MGPSSTSELSDCFMQYSFRKTSHLNLKFNPYVRFILTTGRTSSLMGCKAACFICEECNFCMYKNQHLLENLE